MCIWHAPRDKRRERETAGGSGRELLVAEEGEGAAYCEKALLQCGKVE